VKRHAKASSAGSTQRQGDSLGRFFRGAFVTRGGSGDAKGSGAPATGRRGIFLLLALLAAMALTAVPASATKTHKFKETFGSAAQPTFGEARGSAVDTSTGDLLVMDASSPPSIKRYNPDGTPANFSGLGTNVIDGEGTGNCATVPADCDQTPQNGLGFANANESQIAVDNSGGATAGNIYVTQSSPNAINVFSKEGKYLGQLTESSGGSFSEACGVAVDSAGSVYVGDLTGGIHKYVPAANPPVNADNTANFTTTNEPCTLAAGVGPTAGFLFPAERNGAISKIDSSTGELKYTVSPSSYTTVSVDPATGHVYGVSNSSGVDILDASGAASASKLGSFAVGVSVFAGVALRDSAEGAYATPSGSGVQVRVYGPLITLVDVTTGSASSVEPTSATLNGTVNPDGQALTECVFEWGPVKRPTEPGSGSVQTAPCVPNPAGIGSGTSPVPVSAAISGLEVGKAYQFRLTAANSNGPISGSFQTFQTTGPVIDRVWSETVTFTEAGLKARVNPEGEATTYKFLWGPTSAYGNETTLTGAGSDSSYHVVSAFLEGLSPGTTYHYRLVVANSASAKESKDLTFTTYQPFPPDTNCANQAFRIGASAGLPDCRAYEMVSPVDKKGGDIITLCNLNCRKTAFNQAAIDGDGMTYSSLKAFGDAISSLYTNQYIATRGKDGWTTHSINPSHPGGLFAFQPFETYWDTDIQWEGFTADLSSGWVSDDSIVPQSPEGSPGDINLYQRDNLTDTYLPAITTTQADSYRPQTGFPGNYGQTGIFGFSSDGNHALLATITGLTPDAAPGSQKQLYELNKEAADARQTLTVAATGGTYSLSFTSAIAIGTLQGGSQVVTEVASSSVAGQFRPGDPVSGAGIPNGTTVLSVGEGTLTLSQNATESGKRRIVGHEASAPIAAGASAAQVQAALEAIPGIGSGNVAVSGGPGNAAGSAPYSILFTAALAGVPVQPLAVTDEGLSGGSPSSSAEILMNSYGGHLNLVSILPNGEANPGWSTGGPEPGTAMQPNHGTTQEERLVSEDGSRIFWSTGSSGGGSGGQIYVRLNPDKEQSALNGSNECTEAAKACTLPVGSGALWTASTDGSKALYTNSTDLNSAAALREFDVASATTTTIAGEVVGVLGASEDLSYIYFVSKEGLDGATAGRRNLYMDHNGTITFVARLSAIDTAEPGAEGEETVFPPGLKPVSGYDVAGLEPGRRASRVSPDGRHIAFASVSTELAELAAGYDNTDAKNGERDVEVYTYEAGGEVICASCNPTGAAPIGKELQEPNKGEDDPVGQDGPGNPHLWAASWLPTAENSFHTPRALADDGTKLFFNSFESLVPQDTNGTQDVYEWEAVGAGNCSEASGVFSARNNGCLSLISSGESPQLSEFLDASADGSDVFFLTNSSLLPQDPGAIDIYDARANGGYQQPFHNAACEGETCQNTPAALNDPTPGSATFKGPGNVTEKPAAKKKKKHKKHRRHRKHSKHRRANADRRAHR
jgi:hypothetical protein